MTWKPPQTDEVVSAWTPPNTDEVVEQKGIIRRSAEALVNSPALPIAGGVLGGIVGSGVGSVPLAGLGAAGGEGFRIALGRQMGMDVPKLGLDSAKSVAQEGAVGMAGEGAGKLIGLAVKPVIGPGKKLLSKVGKKGAEAVEAFTGVKPNDVIQSARQGVKTYLAPGMEKAQNIFGNALEKAGIKSRPPLKQVIDPQLSTARKIAVEVGEKLEGDGVVTAEEALRGRQAIDRIYAATPLRDRATRGNLLEIRSAFDKALSGQSGDLAEASKIYRKAVVKSNILNPFRITKQGQISAVTPILASTAGSIVGMKSNDTSSGVGTTALALGATSPLLWGAGITSGADLVRLASSAPARKALLQILARRSVSRKKDNKK